ncbi:MAG TPA: SPOR domain-containing protein [Limnobacter sp.]|uniref:SPOR domain-containing protein n=1 Tax=Limnobacter sp. TaxID=2003368 RepID=UPI002E3071D4|nr:SPOR domain-containing protein [Limnobacter sp.]HEX5486679.1 SPOR domain-containing protein [Limnobacter sp.]
MSSNPRTGSKNKVNNDPVDELKRRSRRRLVGSIALFLFAIIVVPALVEKEPAKKDAPVELVVPSRPNSDPKADFANDEGVADTKAAKPTLDEPAPNSVAPDSKPTAASEKPSAPEAPKVATAPKAEPAPKVEPAPKAEPVPKPAPEVKFDAKPLAKTEAPKETKPVPKAEPKVEPKVEPAKPTEDPIAKFAQGEVLWVQVTALKDGAHAEQIRSELVSKGFPAKVESVNAGASKVYRVRVGPLAGQDKANQTKAALAKQGYNGRVVQ